MFWWIRILFLINRREKWLKDREKRLKDEENNNDRVPDMIDHLVRDIPDAREGFRMICF